MESRLQNTSEIPSLRIALVISELDIGGAEKNFVNLACSLIRRGHDVQAYCLDPRPVTGLDRLVCQLEENGVAVEFVPRSGFWPSPWGHVPELRKRLANFQPQVVYSFLFRANLASTLALNATTTRRSSTQEPSRIVGLRQADPRWWVKTLERYCLRRSHATVCVSRDVAGYYAPGQHRRVPAEITSHELGQILVIPNAVTVAHTDASEKLANLGLPQANGPSASRILLFLGRLTPQKGLMELLKWSPQFLEQLPNHHFVLVGKGPQRRQLEKLATQLPCANRIHFLGWKPNPLDYIQAADVLLLNSKWEGLPNVVLEAMSAGKPFVSTDTHGLDDIFYPPLNEQPVLDPAAPTTFSNEKACGLQVVRSEPAAFATAVVNLAANPDQAKMLGAWNQAWVARYFSPKQFLTAHEQVFLKLAAK